MGGRLTRVFRTFNLESRARREISKEKPTPAPRHPTSRLDELAGGGRYPETDHFIKTSKIVHYLSTVLVKDGGGEHLPCKQEEKRLTKLGNLGDLDIQKVPKGKISIVEALTLLNNHKLHPQIWTAEKIAVEYSLELKEVNSLLEFFIPFAVQEFPKETKKAIKPT
uniref:NADH dehydrogenase [ubiquinone] 1 alpha subcomplex assembly factor 4 n=1 Tax=Calidris pygmaea TaxID=425635 RepID=A0A8C3JJ29_9CHAR